MLPSWLGPHDPAGCRDTHVTATTMAIVADAVGGPEVLQWREWPMPSTQAGEALVRHRAVGLNFIDTYFRSGLYPWPNTPLILGGEAAGVVEAVGPRVTGIHTGDRVAYTLPLGAYCQYRAVSAERLVRLPDTVSDPVAASVMLKGLTAQFLVTSCYPVRVGQLVLVHAAAGGVGLLLGQWLKTIGATTIGTVGSDAKAAVALTRGYDHVINYRADTFVDRVRAITAGRGCDVVFDSVGRDTWLGSLQCLRRRGMIVSFGQSSGPVTEFTLSQLAASSLFASRPVVFDYIADRVELEQRSASLFAMLANGSVHAEVQHTLPLREAAQAHRMLEARRTTGSTILLP